MTKYSEDDDAKQRGGDLGFFDKESTRYPKPVVEAAFKLAEVGDVAPPIKTDKGFAVIRLTQKRPGFNRPLAEVKRQIQQRLFRDTRTKAMDNFVAELKKKSAIEINDRQPVQGRHRHRLGRGGAGRGWADGRAGHDARAAGSVADAAAARDAGDASGPAGQAVKQRRRLLIVLLPAVAALAAALAPRAAAARMVEKIAAVVGENVVLASEVEEKAGPLLADVNKIPDPDKRAARASSLRREVLDRLIDDELILQQAAELKLTSRASRSTRRSRRSRSRTTSTTISCARRCAVRGCRWPPTAPT